MPGTVKIILEGKMHYNSKQCNHKTELDSKDLAGSFVASIIQIKQDTV